MLDLNLGIRCVNVTKNIVECDLSYFQNQLNPIHVSLEQKTMNVQPWYLQHIRTRKLAEKRDG